MNKFIYAFGDKARDVFLSHDYHLLKSDNQNKIYVFENKTEQCITFSNIDFTLSDTLTF